jgi:hypothetical protein
MIEATLQFTDEAPVNPDERVALSPHGAAASFIKRSESFLAIQEPLLDVVRAALVFSAGWRRCYLGCECQRCDLDGRVRALVVAIAAQRQ